MSSLLDPFTVVFVQRALLTGALVAVICGVVGTWVVLRGMAFLGEAMAHGMLPGIAVATLLGIPPVLGAAVSAAGMSLGKSVRSNAAGVFPQTRASGCCSWRVSRSA